MNVRRWKSLLRLSGAALFALTLPSVWAASNYTRPISLALAAGDINQGADVFQQNCAGCHSLEAGHNMVGPSLFSVVGRAAASVADFSYSAAMKGSGIVWSADRLNDYLKAPRRYVPGSKMMFSGLSSEQDRQNVVTFLATLRTARRGSSALAQAKAAGASD